ncbi:MULTISPECIES: hypothetical protein [Streptomyces]|uniref:hypothetical protein n=1 Tax=Streptomyces TaxID=1883 RepID=UPI0016710A80|nr:hypothetical protein [Streptomyces ruber]
MRWVRWLVAVVAAGVTFGMFLWLTRSVSWGWLPEGEAERWGVAAAFAAVVAGAVGAAVSWWAGREAPARQPQDGRSLRARVTDQARVDQAGGHRGRPGGPGRAAPRDVRLDADASGHGQIRQTGGDDYTSGPGTP